MALSQALKEFSITNQVITMPKNHVSSLNDNVMREINQRIKLILGELCKMQKELANYKEKHLDAIS